MPRNSATQIEKNHDEFSTNPMSLILSTARDFLGKTQNRIMSSAITMETSFLIVIALSLLLRLLCIGSTNLLVEEAYYWNYATHLDFGYLDHPPMVAVLVKLSTLVFGTNEFSVRLPSLLCWLLIAYFSFKLTNLITRGAGQYAVMLLAILPFFFLQSLVITPDQPLLICWSAGLYSLYRALVLNESKYWYRSGVWIGLGLLSKYTILLFGPPTLLYVCLVPEARKWLTRKEPYICALIAVFIFTPVIYWNATHDWVSFVFQGTRRFKSAFVFSFHQFIELLILFLTPCGLLGLWSLLNKKTADANGIEKKTQRFLQLFTFLPLLFFGIFSVNHAIRFNWIGPGLLAVIPWLALLITNAPRNQKNILNYRQAWLVTAVVLMISYTVMIVVTAQGSPEFFHKRVLKKFIAWDDLTQQLYAVAKQTEAETNTTPILIPLDLYNTISELSFYQAKFMEQGTIQKSYLVMGCHVFGGESLMFRYWSQETNLHGQTLIIISSTPEYLANPQITDKVIEKSPIQLLWSHAQGRGGEINPYYYQIVQMKS